MYEESNYNLQYNFKAIKSSIKFNFIDSLMSFGCKFMHGIIY